MGRSRWAVLSSEIAAFARQAWLLRHDVGAPVVPADARPGDDVVVLLHGLFATAGVLRPMRAELEKNARLQTAALTYGPGPGVVELSGRLAGLLAVLPSSVRIHLVGHSLGGLVARYHALFAGDERVVQTISLATPFAGVARATLVGLPDLDAKSPLLRRVLLEEGAHRRVPHLSIVASEDAVVPSPRVHALPGGDVLVLECGHNALLFEPRAIRAVERRILEARPAPAATSGDRAR